MHESSAIGFPILTAIVLLPVAGALGVAVTSKRRPELVKLVGLLASVATAALTVWMLAEFETGREGFQFVSRHSWIEAWGISWHLGVDGISLFLLVLSGVLFPLAIVAVKPDHDDKAYYGWLLLLMAGSMGVFIALDLEGTLIHDRIKVVLSDSGGPLKTLDRLLHDPSADVGIVQTDALERFVQDNPAADARRRLRSVARLYDEAVHVVARTSVKDLHQLDGRKVKFLNATGVSDGRYYADDGIEIINFGPGSGAQGHAANESVPIDEMVEAAEIQLDVVQRLLM